MIRSGWVDILTYDTTEVCASESVNNIYLHHIINDSP